MEIPFSKLIQSRGPVAAFAFILPVVLAWCVTAGVGAQVVVVPNELATNNGNDTSAVGAGNATARAMVMYEASHFAALSGPSLLTEFAFRPKTADSPIGPRHITMRMYASTTPRALSSMSTTFSENFGTNKTLVFDGTLTLASDNLPGPGETRQFDFVTKLTTPFLYNPAEGNLVLDVQEVNDDGLAFDTDAATENPAIRMLLNTDSGTGAFGFFARPRVTRFTFEAPLAVMIRASQTEVCWNSTSNLTYQIQYRSALTTNSWTPLIDCFRSTNSTSCVSDSIVAGQAQRFYRVILTNCVPSL